MTRTTALQYSTHALATALLGSAVFTAGQAAGQDYDNTYQERFGDMALFHTTGPATKQAGQTWDRQGDAFLEAVEMPDGSTFTEYYRPVEIHDIIVGECDGGKISIMGGDNITVGTPGKTFVGDFKNDGNRAYPTDDDMSAFRDALRDTLANNNLNSYVDMGGGNPYFEFIIEFDLPLKDNDPDPDDFGELLYFERGTNGGNSWLTLQAVTEDGTALGPAIAISPMETIDTSPPVQVSPWSNQYIGAVGVDISRLGVSETRFLKVRKTSTADSGYGNVNRGGIDFNPDFKFMAVITHPAQLAERIAGYD